MSKIVSQRGNEFLQPASGRQPRDGGGVVRMLITDSSTSVMQRSDSECFLFRLVFLEPGLL